MEEERGWFDSSRARSFIFYTLRRSFVRAVFGAALVERTVQGFFGDLPDALGDRCDTYR